MGWGSEREFWLPLMSSSGHFLLEVLLVLFLGWFGARVYWHWRNRELEGEETHDEGPLGVWAEAAVKEVSRWALWDAWLWIPLPSWLRRPAYEALCWATRTRPAEQAERPLREYASAGVFLERTLSPDAQSGAPPAPPAALLAPSDGRLLLLTPLASAPRLSARLAELLAPLPAAGLTHCALLWLAPGDYRGVALPAARKEAAVAGADVLEVQGARPPCSRALAQLLGTAWIADTQRALIEGRWRGGRFVLVPLGALLYPSPQKSQMQPQSQPEAQAQTEVARLQASAGAAVLLLFEVPPGLEFVPAARPGAHLLLGEPLGRFLRPAF
jgi:phosphatidylserine decarboxylase